jgi:cytochrome c oxidase cbb3-type subunit 3
MRSTFSYAAGALVLGLSIAVRVGAQAPAAPQTPPAGAGAAQGGAPAGGRAGGGGGGGGAARGNTQGFPAASRPNADTATLEHGKSLYEINCRICHGADLRGGDSGGPNLLRSNIVFNDQHGELINPIIKNGKQTPGVAPAMAPIAMPDADMTAISEYIHSVQATLRGQGNPPAAPLPQLNIVVGDAKEGEAYFAAKCTPCHSATGDMRGIGSRVPDPMQLQNSWVQGSGGGGRGGGRGGGGGATPTTVTVTTATGEKVEGTLVRVDDFLVIVGLADGRTRSFARNGDVPKVEIKDPREAHRKLLPTYTDKDMHDVTAYLVTLK